ncbi:class I SAM-dependent methyltransferase [Prochlorococcus marinus]|uniref:SAM-dependent methyltransferase n=1 Tax=Prochlorococcus marinus XMU1408 TaxID=2213228 RepID=A0A318R3N4_PROMR|nr:methyltransferase domain-containing protein [Prochlorococcus marinus]MBW3042530.1 SAM-dependent methyltransferase [Prochlorococcus marinus str. XMU1408]PYE01450.1 SAM-dependent methyltransferase [Prochlorococcus marinus XMU1408]
MNNLDLSVSSFLKDGFNLKKHLINFLQINNDQLDKRLLNGVDDLAALHPGAFTKSDAGDFYEEKVGDAHLIDLASWHLNSSNYIADTLRLQQKFAYGNVLDFGGGIGTHALAASFLPAVEHVWFVDLNPQNRSFVEQRANQLGIKDQISVHRDLESISNVIFDSVICLDVLEHLPDPSKQLEIFLEKLSPKGIALLNWYFYKGENEEYPFHFDDPNMIEKFFYTLQFKYIEIFHPFLITTRAYRPLKK